jgi:hypothetical protein
LKAPDGKIEEDIREEIGEVAEQIGVVSLM